MISTAFRAFIDFHIFLCRLRDQELTAQKLEEEKKQISTTALHLQANLEVINNSLSEVVLVMPISLISLSPTSFSPSSTPLRPPPSLFLSLSPSLPHLLSKIQQVSQEKEATEDKYKKEKKKRMNTERRLRLAEDSLKRLDKALKDSGVKIDLQIETDVKNLKGKTCSHFKFGSSIQFVHLLEVASV